MRYAQIKQGAKLHTVSEAGEEDINGDIIRAGYLSTPLCGAHVPDSGYRMTGNVSLGMACKSCQRVLASGTACLKPDTDNLRIQRRAALDRALEEGE